MINKNQKGYTKEKLCRDELVKEGWTIGFKSIRLKFNNIDFSNLFDVIAFKKNPIFYRHPDWKFISVKNYKQFRLLKYHQEDIKKFAYMYGLEGMSFELWLWKAARWTGRKPNKVFEKAGWHKVLCNRENESIKY